MNVLSIQSAVAYGHVGNSAAVFPLQRLGHEVWPVNTVNFSNHTGYGAWRGPALPAADVAAVVKGVAERGELANVDAVLSGYQGGSDIADVIIDAAAQVRAANPEALYVCDPVMGNAKSGCHVDDAIPPLLRDKVVPVADVITPNQFELGYLTGREATDLESTLDAVEAARAMGPKTVLVTSVERPDRPEGTVEILVVDDSGRYLAQTPYLPFKRNGSGDVTAALFTGHYLPTRDAAGALAKTASSVFDLFKLTFERDSRELELVAAQDFFANPRGQFEVREV
ncbi:pyridoxal kinase PdxY [Corynebacterium frankenforstense]|uniref:pyridoxal kinase PdxY n=1 Tax=Corynebacterium frankenforstense TaxID=1230998 RepID=UPI0025506690|nr:pyridoxal kinase PdxY [Corynebacterium frankenforstense]MDK6259279.1 pyridoxal kinase PdxY [Corynebacterium frankenforstense]